MAKLTEVHGDVMTIVIEISQPKDELLIEARITTLNDWKHVFRLTEDKLLEWRDAVNIALDEIEN